MSGSNSSSGDKKSIKNNVTSITDSTDSDHEASIHIEKTQCDDTNVSVGEKSEKTTFKQSISHANQASRESSLSSIMTQGIANQIEALTHSLSRATRTESATHLQLPEYADAREIIENFVRDAKQQGIHLRRVGITIKDVSIEVKDISSVEGSTFGDVLLLPLTIIKAIRKRNHVQKKKILRNIWGLAEPGKMVLVLGKPGAGCSSFLKVVAGEIEQFHGGITGSISYDGIPQSDMMKHFKSDIIYDGELDVHFPHLTVMQTLDFAIACKTPSTRVNSISKQEYIALTRDLLATIFGLRHTYNTKVGNDFVRGISGGERKRVSLAEALAVRGSLYCWDNATRGLDASTALEYAQAIRTITNILNSTAFVSLYQASENIFNTFDDVTVIYSGRQIYYGLVTEAKKYFEKIGYVCPERQATSEFLTALTDPHGMHIIKPGFENLVPRSAEEFEKAWRNSEEFKKLVNDIEIYESHTNSEETRELYNTSLKQEKSKWSRKQSYFTISYWEQIRLCTKRGFQRIYGDKSYTIINICAAIVQSFIIGSLFFNTPSSTLGAFSRGGILYFALLYYSLMGLANISFDHKPIVQKHKTYSLYHPSAEALATTISAFPFRMIGLTLFLIILYFLSNLRRTASAFFIIYLFLTICAEAINSLFQMVAAACDTVAQANSINGLLMLSLSMYSTYMIQLPEMHPWFKWISYVLPLRYAFEAMLNAEFHGRYMDCGGTLVPSGPGYENISSDNQVCAFIGSQPGQNVVLGDNYLKTQYEYEYSHTWRNFGILWCFLLGYIFFKALITDYKRPVRGGGDTMVYKKGIKHIRKLSDEEASPSLTQFDKTEPFESELVLTGKYEGEVFADLKSTGAFVWRNVYYSIPYEGKHRVLLDDISGYCIPGKLTALMGESGSGKTTLLNTLAQRNDIGVVTSDMLVNGLPIDSSFERRSGYVQQQDIHISELTVRESLQFSARMRRSQRIQDEIKMQYVEKVIQILEMTEYADALVGDIGRGLNVEQRKKLSVGVELVAKPDLLLFLDEPTSGLDSQSAWAIVSLLKKLSQVGQSIICTIHQPSATLFGEFDRLLLLKKGGQTVYFGDVGESAHTLLEYFESNGARKCNPTENPAEYILEVIGAGATASVTEDWNIIWRESSKCSEAAANIEDLINNPESDNEISTKRKAHKYATSYLYQFRYVLDRTATVFWRDVRYLVAKLMLFMIGGLYVGFTFFHVGETYFGLQSALFASFIAIILSAPSMNQIQSRAIASRELFEVRESKSNMFHWSLIVITQYLNELPYHLLVSTIFFVCFYFPLGINYQISRSGVFFLNYCITFQLYFVGLGLLVLYIAPNLPSANVMMGLTLSFLVAFCGVVQPVSLMPGFWTFMWKASPYTYFVQNLVGIMLHDKPVVCSPKESSYFNPPAGQACGEYMQTYLSSHTGYIANPDATSNCSYCIYSVGDNYLTRIGANYNYLWRNFGFFWAYILFNIVAMVCIYYIFHVKGISIINMDKLKYRIKKFRNGRASAEDNESYSQEGEW